jgi:predicted metal-dependent phosphoesterase TrpH
MKYADLHVHTDFSDGTFTPEKVVETAIEKHLSCIAICDHDCVDGIAPSMEYAKKNSAARPIEIIPAVELTVMKDKKEIHMLGYFVSWEAEWFKEILKKIQDERITRIRKMIDKLKRFNIEVEPDTVMRIAGGKGSVGRLHLAQALLETKQIPYIQTAFDKYIGDNGPCYVEDISLSPKDSIELILRAKGVPVLAHPLTLRDDSLIEEFVKCGMRGIEVFHTDHPLSVVKKYEKIAKEHGLLVTGGSDCHGLGKGRVLLGRVKVPYSLVEKLKEAAGAG